LRAASFAGGGALIGLAVGYWLSLLLGWSMMITVAAVGDWFRWASLALLVVCTGLGVVQGTILAWQSLQGSAKHAR